MIDRLPTGQSRFDGVLGGGLPRNAITLIIGVPGSGKTILAQQIVFHNATAASPALYLSTVTEPFDKILRYGQSLTFFDVAAVRDGRVVYQDLGGALLDGGLDAALATLARYLKESRPSIVVIDSIRALRAFAKDDGAYRLFLDAMTRQLSASATSVIWIDEYPRHNAQDAAEFAVADAIIALDIKQLGEREQRTVQVLKLRGSAFRSGQHSYRLSAEGFNVFPRLADELNLSSYAMGATRISSGVPALDEMLGEGFWPGASTLVVGPTGVGKTLVGLHFLFEGTRHGENVIHATFQENQTQLERIAGGFGWSLQDPHVSVLSSSPVDVYIDEWVYQLLDLAESKQATRIVIDSLPDVMAAAGEPTRFREWMFSLVQRCTRRGISLMMTLEVNELYAISRITEHGLSHLADNVIILQYDQDGATRRVMRTLTVLKTRATRHDPTVRHYEITSEGLSLAEGERGVS